MISFDKKFSIKLSRDYSKFNNDNLLKALINTMIHLGSIHLLVYGRLFFGLWGICWLLFEG